MTRSMPLLAILLFLLHVYMVHSLVPSRHGKKNLPRPSATPQLVAREDFSSFNQTMDSPELNRRRKSTLTTTTKTNNPPPSVTTIIIIQSNGQTFHELGGGNNGPSTTIPNSGNGVQDPNESNIEAQVTQDNAELKRLITISTVVGGVGVVMVIAGTIVYFRLRSKRRRRRQLKAKLLDSPSDNNRGNNDNNGHHHHPSSPSSSSSSSITAANDTSHPQESSSPTSPSESGHRHNFEAIEMSLIIPSAPPAPTLLPTHLRERHQQSILLQQHESPSSPPEPSAPSAKELELNLPSSSSSTTSTSPPPTAPSAPSSSDNFQSSSSYHHHVSIHLSPPSPRSSKEVDNSVSLSPHLLHLKPLAGSNGSDSNCGNSSSSSSTDHSPQPPLTPDLPPPAYTPSAPPLFILPPSQRRRSADQLSLDRYRRYQG